jgi:hypothetical protein
MTPSPFSLLPSLKVFENLVLTLTKLAEGSIESPALYLAFGLTELPSANEQGESRSTLSPSAKLKSRALAAVNEFTPAIIQRSSLEKLVTILKNMSSSVFDTEDKDLIRFKTKQSISRGRKGSNQHDRGRKPRESRDEKKTLRRKQSDGPRAAKMSWRERVEKESRFDDVTREALVVAHSSSLIDSIAFIVQKVNGNMGQNTLDTLLSSSILQIL